MNIKSLLFALACGAVIVGVAGIPLRLAGRFPPEFRGALIGMDHGVLHTGLFYVPWPRPAVALGETLSLTHWAFTAGLGTS